MTGCKSCDQWVHEQITAGAITLERPAERACPDCGGVVLLIDERSTRTREPSTPSTEIGDAP